MENCPIKTQMGDNKMKKYDVVIESTLEELIRVVNIAVEHGYYPKGGILHLEGKFIQTIFKRDPNE